ncbi:MAG: hypothetical protein HY897_00745 [Deltaproteobacteria bacterium]|nr:hypothetical protein [Deltaproteobacteria bacterium]
MGGDTQSFDAGPGDTELGDAVGDTGDQGDGGGDAGEDAADAGPVTPPSSGVVEIDACSGVDDIPQKCSWRYLFDESKCSAASRCDKLVLFWAGGEQACGSYDKIMRAFADAGYFATCVQLFEDSDGAGMEPYNKESQRVDLTVKRVVSSPITAAVWSGKDLLLGEGNNGGPCILPVPHARVVGRYYPTLPAQHSCTNEKCACDLDHHSPEMDEDSITGMPASSFAVRKWKLIECGSALAPCSGDIMPKGPIEKLCATINASPDHNCLLEAMPNDSHSTCAAAGIDKCVGWFDALGDTRP